MFAFIAVISAATFVLSLYLESYTIFYISIIFAFFLNITAFWKSDKLVLKMTGAKECKRQEYFDLWNACENISISIGAKMPKLYVIEDEAPNAFATGRNPENSTIAVTTGLLRILDKSELEGVVAHEMAHIQNRDTLFMTILSILVITFTIMIDIGLRVLIFSGGGNSEKKNPFLLVALVVVMVLTPIALTILKLSFSRKREFLADATGAIYTRHPEALASALKKISSYNKPMKKANTATAHLFISDPFFEEGSKSKIFSFHKLFNTHPPIDKRIDSLMGKS